MLLIKCKCGCHFTIKSLASLRSTSSPGTLDWTCQNCDTYGYVDGLINIIENCNKLDEKGFSICILPEDATIEIKYNV